MVEAGFDRGRAAAQLHDRRDAIAARLAALVASWPKYATAYAADPAAFAGLETRALVDYLVHLIGSGDENYRHLYVGEKAKQFHDPAVPADDRRAREARLLAGERAAFLAELDDPRARAFVTEQFDAIDHALTAEASATVKALFVGDCLHLDIIGFLTAPALADGVRIEPSFITSHIASEIQAQAAALADERFDIVFFSPFTYTLLSDYEALHRPRALADPRGLKRHIDRAVADGLALFDALADLFDCPVVAHLPAPIYRHEGTLGERLRAAIVRPAMARATRRLSQGLRERAAARIAAGQAIHLLDEHAVIGAAGIGAAGRFLYRSDLQHPAAFGAMIAPFYRDLLFVAGRLLKRKLVACDLDNTLWQGVIGEGLGIVHHYDRQAPLLALKARGVVLAINSKNDPAKAVWEAAEGRLALDHFVSRQINWDPKPLNMARIAEHLNLKEKDFVFIDDRADERAMVAERYPAMLTLDAVDPRSWHLLALWAELLPAKPNADRTDFYRQRDARQAFIAAEAGDAAAARAESFAKLDLRLTLREAAAGDIDRVTDLINRTNQFNMTGARVTRKRIEELVARDDAWVLIADAADRFGAMGTIGVLIAAREEGRIAIPTFVLSCRVFGYGMEFALIDRACRMARPGEPVFGPMTETPFNQPCRGVYRDAGFHPVDGGWQLDDPHAAASHVPAWLTVTGDGRLDPVMAG